MPSYRYTREIQPEDLQPEQPPELSGKEKRKNWWHYHWKLVGVIALALALLGFFIGEVVGKPKPDMSVVLLTSKSIPDAVTELLRGQLGHLIGDLNGDGRVEIEVLVCTVNPYDEDAEAEAMEVETDMEVELSYEDPYAQMAGITRLVAALDDDATMLFIMETDLVPQYQQSYGILGYLDGSLPAENADDYENMVLAWQDSPVLSSLDFSLEYEGGVFDAQEYMSFFSVGVRRVDGTRLEASETARQTHGYVLGLVQEWMPAA